MVISKKAAISTRTTTAAARHLPAVVVHESRFCFWDVAEDAVQRGRREKRKPGGLGFSSAGLRLLLCYGFGGRLGGCLLGNRLRVGRSRCSRGFLCHGL